MCSTFYHLYCFLLIGLRSPLTSVTGPLHLGVNGHMTVLSLSLLSVPELFLSLTHFLCSDWSTLSCSDSRINSRFEETFRLNINQSALCGWSQALCFIHVAPPSINTSCVGVGAVTSSPLRAPCELFRPPQSFGDVAAASRSLGNQQRAPAAASQVSAHRRRPISSREEGGALMGERGAAVKAAPL